MSGWLVTFLMVRPDLTPRWQLFVALLQDLGAQVRVIAPAGERAMDVADVSERIAVDVPGPGRGWLHRLRAAASVHRAARGVRSDVWVITHPTLLPGAHRLGGKFVYEVAEFWELELRMKVGRAAALLAPLWSRWEAVFARNAALITVVDSKCGWLAARYRRLGVPVEVVFNVPSLCDDALPWPLTGPINVAALHQ